MVCIVALVRRFAQDILLEMKCCKTGYHPMGGCEGRFESVELHEQQHLPTAMRCMMILQFCQPGQSITTQVAGTSKIMT